MVVKNVPPAGGSPRYPLGYPGEPDPVRAGGCRFWSMDVSGIGLRATIVRGPLKPEAGHKRPEVPGFRAHRMSPAGLLRESPGEGYLCRGALD